MNLHGGSRGKAEPRAAAGHDPAAPPRPQAGFFGPPATPLFGWLHGAALPSALGVVICAPLGHEMTNAHRSLRALAMAAAAAGVPALRFDYAGCGDSADPVPAVGDGEGSGSGSGNGSGNYNGSCSGNDKGNGSGSGTDDGSSSGSGSGAGNKNDGGSVPAWLASIGHAIDHLRRCTGVRRVALLGLRSGALLALAAADRDDVADVAALAPVTSGQRLLREWRALQSTAALRSTRSDGAMEVAGHLFDAATCTALGALGLQAPAGVRQLLVLDRDDLPGADRWVATLRGAGADVRHQRLPGFGPMLDEPQRHVVPEQVVRQTADWLRERAAATAAAAAAGAANEGMAPAAATPWADAEQPAAVTAAVVERPLHCRGGGGELFGIVSQAADGAAPRRTLLLVNTGPVHHVGGNRLYVTLARRLAAGGHSVLRLDLSGIGDSAARHGEDDNVVYGERATEDIALALAGLQVPHGQGAPVELLGLCSGGYHALKYALAHDGVARAFVVNPLVFYWKPGMSLEAGEVDVQAAYYRTKWRDPRRWWRLFSGQSDLRLLAQVGGRRARASAGWLVRWLRRGGITLALDDLADDLAAVARRGTHLHFIFSQGEPGLRLLHAEAGASAAGLQQAGALSIHTLDAADHTFTTEDARDRFMAHVQRAIEHPPGGR